MVQEIKIHFRDGHLWSCEGQTYVRGEAFDGPALQNSGQLARLFASLTGRDEFVATVRRLNGFFAVVQLVDGTCRLAVDRVRSIPLFYGSRDARIYVSDDCHWVESHTGDGSTSKLARAEFLHLGFVTGRDTLCPDVKQCLAGESVYLQLGRQTLEQQTCRYFRYQHNPPREQSNGELFREHGRVLQDVFGRLIQWADGRTIVIPLSGGHDSRLVALMLRKLDYPKVITFSYGRPGNEESQCSLRVAADLGFEWKFVEYNNRAWANWYHSDQRIAYQRYCGTLSCVAHIQDWPAIGQLTKRCAIPADSVIVPGHTGDFIAGGRSTSAPELYKKRKLAPDRIVCAILDYHYELWRDRAAGEPMWPAVIQRLRQQVEEMIADSAENNASVYERWNWENRQAKWIVNAVRAYEFCQLAWWLPLWDRDYIEFWADVPLKHRIEKRWYNSFVDTLYRQVAGKRPPRIAESVATRIRKRLYRIKFVRVMRQWLPRRAKAKAAYDNHPLCWFGLVPEEQFRSLYTGTQSVYSFMAAENLGEITISDPRSRGVYVVEKQHAD